MRRTESSKKCSFSISPDLCVDRRGLAGAGISLCLPATSKLTDAAAKSDYGSAAAFRGFHCSFAIEMTGTSRIRDGEPDAGRVRCTRRAQQPRDRGRVHAKKPGSVGGTAAVGLVHSPSVHQATL